MTIPTTQLTFFAIGGLWPDALTPEQAQSLGAVFSRLEWPHQYAWHPYAQAMPYVPGQPHWSWLWAELVRNQVSFRLSPYTWLALGGPRVSDALYEVQVFAKGERYPLDTLALWDAVKQEALNHGGTGLLWNTHVFWRFKTPIEGVWAPSLEGEPTGAPAPIPAWEAQLLAKLQAIDPAIDAVRVAPGGALTRLKPSGWRAILTADETLQGLAASVGMPRSAIHHNIEAFITCTRAPGPVLVADMTLLPYVCRRDWQGWLKAFEALHQAWPRLLKAIEPVKTQWVLSGTVGVLGLTPEAPSRWPWRRTPEPLPVSLFSEKSLSL